MGKPWLKLWTETLTDRKLTRLAPAGRWAWVGLLMLAAETDNAGKLELAAGVPLNDDDIAEALHISPAEWTEAKAHFLRMGMIEKVGGALIVANYEKRQATKDPTAAERMRNYRARNTEQGRNVTRNVTRKLRVESESESESESEPPYPPNLPNGKGDDDDFSLVEHAHGQWIGPKISLEQATAYEEWLKITTPQAVIDALKLAAAKSTKNGGRFRYACTILQGQRDDRTLPLRPREMQIIEVPDEVANPMSWM